MISALAWSGQRNAALAQYTAYRELLEQEFGIEPTRETMDLYEQICAEKLEPPRWPLAAHVPLPLTSFVGRQCEIGQVQHLLDTTRLLTLTGAGGCGKTRLALEAARNLAEEFSDGVWYVDLAPLADPALVVQSVAAVLGVREQPGAVLLDQVLDCVRPKQLLLVLDNCEHLRAACAQLVDNVLRIAPQAQLLVTSREPLDLEGETVYRVPSLQIPERDHSAQALAEIESVALFMARAKAAQPGFELTEANAAAIAHICQQLDGIPLAIELAAARVTVLTAQQIAGRLQDALGLLTQGSPLASPHHQTLQATLDWSHALLTEQERRLFRRLAVFAGSFTLEAVEAICSGEDVEENQMLDALSGLVSKSLVAAEPSGEDVRFRLHEIARQYAHVKLSEAERSDGTATRHRHAEYYLALAERAEPELHCRDQLKWLERLKQELGNLRAALGWALAPTTSQPDTGPRLAAALWWFWYLGGYESEGRQWLERALAKEQSATARTSITRMKALARLAILKVFHVESKDTGTLIDKGIALSREIDDKESLAFLLIALGGVLRFEENLEQATAKYEESLSLFREIGYLCGVAFALDALACAAYIQDDFERLAVLAQESLAIRREIGDITGIGHSLTDLADVARMHGDYEQAIALLEEGLTQFRSVNNRPEIAYTLRTLGSVMRDCGRYEQAAQVLDESVAIYNEIADLHGAAIALCELGNVAWRCGDHQQATRYLEESLGLFQGFGDTNGLAYVELGLGDLARLRCNLAQAKLHYTASLLKFSEMQWEKLNTAKSIRKLAEIAILEGQLSRAVQLLGAAEAIQRQVRIALAPVDQVECDQMVIMARTHFGAAAFDAAWAEGRALTAEQAIAYALEDPVNHATEVNGEVA